MTPNDLLKLAKSPTMQRLNPHLVMSEDIATQRAQEFDRQLADAAAPRDEKHLQGQIEGLLKRNGYYPIRQRMDRKSNVAVGTPDILFAARDGRATAWEVKLPGNKPRPEQEQAMREMNEGHWKVAVVTSYAQALQWVQEDDK
jgi:hypothetical protein